MPRIPDAIRRAAVGRAAGNSWSAVASTVGVPLAQLEEWVVRHPRAWRKLMARERQNTRDAAHDEALSVLRTHLRNEDLRTQFNAAKHLTSMTPDRSRDPDKSPPAPFGIIPDDEIKRLSQPDEDDPRAPEASAD
ncbi:MAG: hypothetical protein K1X57_13935 [Gemmataceae bacterium]|nr:hypothetical protein [Gemmataceae bacterium]